MYLVNPLSLDKGSGRYTKYLPCSGQRGREDRYSAWWRGGVPTRDLVPERGSLPDTFRCSLINLQHETSTGVLANFSREIANAKQEFANFKRKFAEFKQKFAVFGPMIPGLSNFTLETQELIYNSKANNRTNKYVGNH